MEKTAHKSEFPHRATLLAYPGFFLRRFIFEKIIFAEIPAGEGVIHGVAVHLENQNLYCTCPFWPKPCVHALALMALFESAGETIFTPVPALPAWVSDLQKGLPAKPHSSAISQEKAEAGKQQRHLERLERAANGFDDLEAWLLDTARRGLATVVSEDPKWWEGIAARMADASMTGLSRTLRLLGQIPATAPDWSEQVAAVFADCYLAVRAFRKRDTLPEALLRDLQNFIGISTRTEDALTLGEKVMDDWGVLGQIEAPLEDKLMTRRTWLLGENTGMYALLLDFSFGNTGFLPGLDSGSVRQGTLAFYPSAFPQRALVVGELIEISKEITGIPGFGDFDIFVQHRATTLAKQPWLQILPALFSEVRPQVQGRHFFIVDKNEKSLRLNVDENTGWRIVALSGGAPVSMFGEWDDASFRPLSVLAEGRFVVL